MPTPAVFIKVSQKKYKEGSFTNNLIDERDMDYL